MKHCNCHDPLVFGHNHDAPTFRAGETFTITGGRVMHVSEAMRLLNQATENLRRELYRMRTRAQ